MKLDSGERAVLSSGMLTVVFIILRLTGVIRWPWVWVVCPLWIIAAWAVMSVATGIILAVVKLKREDDNNEDQNA